MLLRIFASVFIRDIDLKCVCARVFMCVCVCVCVLSLFGFGMMVMLASKNELRSVHSSSYLVAFTGKVLHFWFGGTF